MLAMRFFTLLLVAALFVTTTTDAARHKAKHLARNRHHVLAKQGVNAADKVGVLARQQLAAGAKKFAVQYQANKVNGADESKDLAKLRGADEGKDLAKVNGADEGQQLKMPAAGVMMNKQKYAVKKRHANQKARQGVLVKNQVKVNAAGL